MSFRLKKSFDSSKCKTLLQLTLQRLKVLRNKHALAVKRSRADAAKLLEKRQDATAKMQVESVFIEEKIVVLYEILEQFCQCVINGLDSIKSQRECPSDLKEAVASLIFAAPRCGDLEELQKVSKLLTSKYGTEFSVAAKELRPDCGVNTQIIRSLSSVSLNSDAKLKLLKEIALESKINWDYEMATADTARGVEDVLDGPNHFVSATQVSNVVTLAIPENHNSRSMTMHASEVKGQASTVLQNAIGSRTMSSVEKPSSLGLPLHNPHQFAKTNTNTGTKGALRAPDGAIHTPILDPYALAKARGKMDYKVVSDYMIRADVTEAHPRSMEWKQEKQDAAAYGKLATQSTRSAQDLNEFIDASYSEDALQRSKEKKSHGMMNVVRDKKTESKSKHQEDLSNSHGISKGRKEAILLDLETAAETAFMAASKAAEAARAAAVLVRMESCERLKGSRVVNANKLQEKYSESSSGSVWDENHKLAGMDLERFAGGENCEVEIESCRENLVVSKQVPEANACPILDTSGDLLKYVVFEQTSGSQKYVRSSTETEGYNTKPESYAFQQAWSDITQHSSKDSDRVIWDAEHEELESKEMATNDFFDSFYGTGVKEQELDRKRSSRTRQENIFDHADVQQDKFVQNDFPVPQFDDYDSEGEASEEELLEEARKEEVLEEASDDELCEEACEEEIPFYLKGRAAVVTEDRVNGTAWVPSSKRSMSMSTSDLINDDQAEESSISSSEQDSSLRDNHAGLLDVSIHKGKHVDSSDQNDAQNRSEESRFDDYTESVSSPVQSFKTPSRSQTCIVSKESISESSITSPVADNESSGNPDTPRELRWHSLTSKRSDLDSRYDKVLSPLSSVKFHSLDEGLSGYEDKGSYNPVDGKLNFYSGGSEDSESVSERSFDSQKPRWNQYSSELSLQSPKPPFYMEDGTRVSKPDPGLTTQAPETSRGKTYVGMSRRSVRSTRAKQAQDGPSPPSGYGDLRIPSTGDESNYRFLIKSPTGDERNRRFR